MGGLVVAKAVTLADSHRNRYSTMFEAIAAAIFFGTPFKGADSALLASTYASLSGRVGLAVPSELLDLSMLLLSFSLLSPPSFLGSLLHLLVPHFPTSLSR